MIFIIRLFNYYLILENTKLLFERYKRELDICQQLTNIVWLALSDILHNA